MLRPSERLVILVGAYGSGKTEVAVNMALQLARSGRAVQLADLDLVNPYFRSREAQRVMERAGVRVVVPPGAQAFADLPIVLPEIRGLLTPPKDTVSVLDVGGDDVGARVLSSFRPVLDEGAYALWQVVNGNRPFTSTVEGCLALRAGLELASRLRVTGLVGNTHLTDETSLETVLAGNQLVGAVSRASSLPVRAITAPATIAGEIDVHRLAGPLLRLERHMLPPWLGHARSNTGTDFAARPTPIGVPPPLSLPPSRGDPHGSRPD
ncbi:MAG: cobalamin biosynthesis protein CbiA [Planctomycetota bacterium]|nr:cobalamin biosynthesis protein CbiA [Planctomycetota bacterium]